MFFSFSFCFVCFCASSWQAVNTCAIRWISNGIPMSWPHPSPLPVSHSQVRTMYFAFTVQRSRRHVQSLSVVVVVFVFVFVAARNGQCTHTIPAAAAAAGARECEWVRAPYCVNVCLCLCAAFPRATPMLLCWEFLFCYGCIRLPVSANTAAKRERETESERASERREVFVRERKHFQFSWRRRLPSSAASLSHALLDAARFRFLRFRNAHATSTSSALHHLSISLTNTKATKTNDRLWEG